MHLLCIFSLFSSCFRTPDTVQPELQPTPQTSTLQAGNELGRGRGWGGGPGTDIVAPLPLTLWVLDYPFQSPSAESPGLLCRGAAS